MPRRIYTLLCRYSRLSIGRQGEVVGFLEKGRGMNLAVEEKRQRATCGAKRSVPVSPLFPGGLGAEGWHLPSTSAPGLCPTDRAVGTWKTKSSSSSTA
jgi:hypothetical protein